MATSRLDFWYDQQIKKYLLQIIRVFASFSVAENTSTGIKYNRIPARYADSSRMVASLLRKSSENAINNAPMIAISIESLAVSRERSQDPFNVDTKQIAERAYNYSDGSYGSDKGNLYTIKRYMPTPYDLTIKADIWTTNTDTKLQLLEQILVLFNPSIQLQTNSNPLDWSNVFELELTDTTWSSRSLPAGVDDTIDVASLTFKCGIWLSPPAKVQRQAIIEQIVTNMYRTDNLADLGFNEFYYDFFGNIDTTSQIIITPGDLRVQVYGDRAVLVDNAGVRQSWVAITESFGQLTETSTLKLNLTNDSENDSDNIVGTVELNNADLSELIFTVDTDTLPSDTVSPIAKIIDPSLSYPGSGLPASSVGQRYLITERTIQASSPWGLDADPNDIIQYTGSAWTVVFDASNITTEQYVTNTYTGRQYRWTGAEWVSSYEGEYMPGFFKLVL